MNAEDAEDTVETTLSSLCQLAGEAATLYFRAAPNRESRLRSGAWLALSGEPVADLNIGLIARGAKAEEHLNEFAHVLLERHLPALVLLSPAVADALAPTAQSLGLQAAGKMPLMVRGTGWETRASARYRFSRVDSLPDLATANQLLANGFDLPLDEVNRAVGPGVLDAPGLSIFIAWEGDRPVSTVMIAQAGPVAGVWCMGTAPGHQRQGAGRALLEHALAFGHERGATQFYLLATEAGKPLYDHIGFTTLAALTVWVFGHSTQVSAH